jgi:hypothetical protein
MRLRELAKQLHKNKEASDALHAELVEMQYKADRAGDAAWEREYLPEDQWTTEEQPEDAQLCIFDEE